MTRPVISFEFFPPRNIEAAFRLWDTVKALAPLQPQFVSVTYGAGGTTRQITHEAVGAIHKATGLNVAAHLTCVNATRAETLEIAEGYAAVGVTEIVALRGDPPKGQGKFTPHPEGFQGSVELIQALAETGKFKIRVGAYPERHPDAADTQADIEHLKRKFDAGADSAITQLFFEADTYFRFRDACAKAGIEKKIIPGLFPIENWRGAQKFATSCGSNFSAALAQSFEEAEAKGAVWERSVDQAVGLCEDLMRGGVEHLHFYTLNKPDLTRAVTTRLGL